MASKPPESSESSSDSSTASSSPPRRGVFIDEGRNEIRFIDDPDAIVREPPSPSTPAPAKSALKRSSSAPAASSHHRTALLLSSWSQDMEFSSKAGDERPKPPRGTRMLRLKAEKEAASKPQPPPKKLPSSSEEDSDVSDTDKDAKKKATKEAAAQRESRSRDSEDEDAPPGPSRGRRRQPTPFVRGASHDGSSDGADSAGASTCAASKTKASSQSSKSKTDYFDVSDEDDDDPGLKEKPKPFEDIDEAIAAIEKALREDAEEEAARKAASKASARPPRPPPKQASTVDVSATSPPPAAAAAAAAAPPQTAQSDTVLLSEDDPTSDFVEVLAEKRPPSPTASEIEILDDAAPVRGAGSGSGYSAEDLAEMMRGSIVDSDEDAIGAGGGDGGSPGGMSIGESDEDDGQDGEGDDYFMHLIDGEGDIRENVDEPMEEQEESMADTAIRGAADAEAAEEAIEDLVESMDDVAIKGSPKKGAAGETTKRKKHLTEADKLLSDEGALKMLTTASPRRRRAAASDDKKRRTSPRKPASATEESDDSQIEKMDGGDDRDKKKKTMKTMKKHIAEAERLRMERLRVQNIPESLTPIRQSTTAQGGTSGTAHDESTMTEVSDVAAGGEKSVGEEEAEKTKGTDPFVAPTSPAARRASLVPDSSTESAESSAESEARKKKVEARQALPMKVASEEDSASDTPGKKEKRKRLTEAERLLQDEMVQKMKESQEQKRSPKKTGVTAGKSKDFDDEDDEDDDEEKSKKKRLTVAGGRLSGSPEKEQSPAKKSAAPVDSEDSEREDDDTNQVEGKKKKYATRTEKVAADDAGVMEMTSLTLPSAPIDDTVEVSTDETKEGETRSKPKRKRRSEADKLLGDEGVRKMLAEEESKSRSRAEGAEPGNQAGEEPVEEPVDEKKKEEVNEEGDKKRSEEKTKRKRRLELDTLGLDEGVQRMGISPLGERPKRRGRSVEGARTYALDLDEEEEEEEEHQEDDWMPSDADHDDQEPMDEPAIPEDPTIVDEPMEPVDAQAGEQPGEKADDVFAKPATPSEASTTPSAKSAAGAVQSGAEGASSAISSAPSTEGSSAAGGVRKPKRRPKTEIENLLFSDETSIKHFEEQKRNYEERQRELQKSKISKAERARIMREAAARQQEEIAANVRRIDEAEAEEERQMKEREERQRAEAAAKRAEREAQARREEEARKITEKMELAELRELLLREGRQLRQVRGPGHDRHASVRSTRLEEEEEMAARGREREARGTSHASVRSHASIRSHVSARSARLEEEMAARRAEEAAHPERAPARMTPAQLAAVAAHMRAVFGLRAAPSSGLQPPKAEEPQSSKSVVGSKARSRLEMEEAARLAQHQSELMQQQQQQQMREEEEERREHNRRVEAHDEQVARMMQEREQRLASAEQEQLAAALHESLRTAEHEKALRRAQGQPDSDDDDNETGDEPKPGGSGMSRQRMTLDEQLRAASVALGPPPESASTRAEIAEARRKKAAAAKEELLASRQGRPVQPPAEEVEQFEHESEAMRLATMEAIYNESKKSEVQKRLEAREATEAAAAAAAAAAQPAADSAGSSSVSATASIVDESPTTTKPKQRKQRVREADKLKQDEGVKKMNIDNDSPDAPKQQRTRTTVHREGQIQLPDELPEGEAENMFDAVPTQKTPKQQPQQLQQQPQHLHPLRQLPPQPQIRPNELIESMRQMASKARASRTDSGLRPGMISLFPLPRRQLHVEMSGIPQQQQHDVPSNEIVADEPTDEASLAEKPSLIYPHDYLEEQELMIKSEPALSAFDQDGNLIGQLTSPLKPPAGFEMFEDMGEESHIPKPPTGFPSPGGMTGHQGEETPTTSSLLPPGPPPPSSSHAVFDAMAAAASHAAARAAPTVHGGHPTPMGLAAEAPLFRATDSAGGVIRHHMASYKITQPHPIGQDGGDEEDDETLLDVGGPDDYGAHYDDSAVDEPMEQQMEVDEADMAPKKKLSKKKGQKESKGFAAIKARHDKYQDEQRAMAEKSGIVESDDEDKPSDNDDSPKKKKLPERNAKAVVMSARLRARKQPSPDDPGDDDDGSGSGSGSGDDVSDDSEESFEVKKCSKAEKDEKRRKMAIIAAQRMENEERAKREEEARLREETRAKVMEQARIEALQARGARPHDVVDDDGMTMDYDDGHMDWGDDGHHHSMMMQQQSSAARIPRAPPGPPARTPLGPPRRPPGTPAKRARGSLSLIPGPKKRPRDPKKLQQRKPRSPSKKKRAARPPKAPPVQEDPNLPPWRQKINAVLRRRDRLILVALPGVTQNRIFARCRSTNKNKKDFWGYSFLPLDHSKILNRQRAWRFVHDSILIFRLPDGTFTYTDPSDPEDEFRRDGPRRYAAMLLQRRVTQKKSAAQRMPTLQQWLEEAAIERREKEEKEREQLYWDSDLDSEERRSDGGSLSPGEPPLHHHTTPRMASIDAETIRRHMAEMTIGTEEMARRYREGKYPEPWRALLDNVDNYRNRALTEREEEAEENEEWRHDAPEDKIPIPYELSRRPILVKYMETLDNDPHFSKQYISEKELNTIRAQLIGMERRIMNYEESNHRQLPTKKHDYKLYACRSLELNAVFKRRHEKDQNSRAVQYPEEFELIRQADESLGIAVTPDARTEIYYTKGNRAEEWEVKKLMEETGFPVKGRLPKRRFIKIKTDLFFPEYFISLSIFTKKAMPEKWLQLMDRSRRNGQNGPFEQKLEIKLLLDSRRMTGFVRTLHRRNFIDTTKVTLSQVMGWNQQLIDYHWTFDQINASVDDLLSETKSWKQHADEKVQHQWRRGLRPGTGLDPVTVTKAKKRRVKAPKPAKIRHPRSWGPTTATAEQQEPEKEQPKESAETGPPKKRGRPPKKNKKKPGRKPKLLQPAESEQ